VKLCFGTKFANPKSALSAREKAEVVRPFVSHKAKIQLRYEFHLDRWKRWMRGLAKVLMVRTVEMRDDGQYQTEQSLSFAVPVFSFVVAGLLT
jgi:hypothetical protein